MYCKESLQVSIVTVGMNHLSYIQELYQSLYVDAVPSVTFEAIYVDNCSTDGSAEFLRDNYPQVKIVQNEKPYGFGFNNNLGVQSANGECVALLNPDVILKERAIDVLYEYVQHNDFAGIVVPKLLNTDGTLQRSVRRFISPNILLGRLLTRGNDLTNNTAVQKYLCEDIDRDVKQNINWSVGAALFMRRETYKTLGGFDTDYFLYMEDEDLCLRAWKQGCSVMYLPNSEVVHNHIRLTYKSLSHVFMHLRSMLTFFRKHGFSIPDYALNYNIYR